MYGVVTHTGHDTRIMRNSVNSKQKQSDLERYITKSIFVIIAVMTLMAAIASVYLLIWTKDNENSVSCYLGRIVPEG